MPQEFCGTVGGNRKEVLLLIFMGSKPGAYRVIQAFSQDLFVQSHQRYLHSGIQIVFTYFDMV